MLKTVPGPVTLVQADFSEALADWSEPVDVVWICMPPRGTRWSPMFVRATFRSRQPDATPWDWAQAFASPRRYSRRQQGLHGWIATGRRGHGNGYGIAPAEAGH
jgi:hypothetical protein